MRVLLNLIFLFTSIQLFCQNSQSDVLNEDFRLETAFGKEYLDLLEKEAPQTIKRLNYYLDNSWYMMEENEEKKLPLQGTISIDLNQPINIFFLRRKFNLKTDWNLPMAYSIQNSKKLLVLKPGRKMNQSFQEYINQL